MRIVHEDEVLATNVEVADSFVSRARGLMFRGSIPEDFALVFPFPRAAPRSVHMVFVSFPIDVAWVAGETVERVARLSPWTGLARARADTIIEFPAGATDGVESGDTIRVESPNA